MFPTSCFILFIVCVLFQAVHVTAFANYMTKEECHVPLEVGEIIMGKAVKLSDEISIKVYRNDEEVSNGSHYSVGDKLIVKLEPAPPGMQLVFEVRGGLRFYGGKCDGRVRTNTYGAAINVTPNEFASAGDELSIIGAWAMSYSEGVKIAEKFVLYKNAEAVTVDNTSSDL